MAMASGAAPHYWREMSRHVPDSNARMPTRKSSNGVQSPRLFSRIVVLWLFLTFYLVQWQSSAFASYRATRPNVLYRSNLASSNPLPVWHGEPRPKNYLDD